MHPSSCPRRPPTHTSIQLRCGCDQPKLQRFLECFILLFLLFLMNHVAIQMFWRSPCFLVQCSVNSSSIFAEQLIGVVRIQHRKYRQSRCCVVWLHLFAFVVLSCVLPLFVVSSLLLFFELVVSCRLWVIVVPPFCSDSDQERAKTCTAPTSSQILVVFIILDKVL